MGWRGAIRSFGAMARAAERDARRRAREHAHHLAEIGKIEAKEEAAEAVREFEAFLQSWSPLIGPVRSPSTGKRALRLPDP